MGKGGGGKGKRSGPPGKRRRSTSLLGEQVPETLPALLPDAALHRVDGLKVVLHTAGKEHMSRDAYARVYRSAGRIGASAYLRERRVSQGLPDSGPWVAAVGGERPMAQGDTGPAPWFSSRTCMSMWGAGRLTHSMILKLRVWSSAKRAAT